MTGRAGQIIAIALIGFGFFIAFVRGDFFTGFWTVLVGLFLYDAATSELLNKIRDFEDLYRRRSDDSAGFGRARDERSAFCRPHSAALSPDDFSGGEKPPALRHLDRWRI